ncbi:MAG TPA: hypothetical protein DD979_15060 [Gammaproteobacteria bacterium]|jgi:hypothetical protein|nr:hypothetical protein [Gammaproteobacteria bacterium]
MSDKTDKALLEIVGAALLLGMTTVYADNLIMADPDSLINPDAPRSGSLMEDVAVQYGEPKAKRDPVGQPPISSWEYDQFKVYFEHDRVIHSVSR